MLISVLRKLVRRQKGQSLALVALAMMAMIGVIGLAIDVGMIMSARRSLVRLTDAAALAAASALSGPGYESDALRQGRAIVRAHEYVRLNGYDPTPSTGNISVTVTFPGTAMSPQRKIVEVTTSRRVILAFMRLFGFYETTVTSSARQGESAPLDIVLVMDTSGSQFLGNHELCSDASALIKSPPLIPQSHWYDWCNDVGWGYGGDTTMLAPNFGYDPTKKTIYPKKDYLGNIVWPPSAAAYAPYNHSTDNGRVNIPWEPFQMQQAAAHYFIAQLDARYDKIAVVAFSSAGSNIRCGSSPACIVQQLTNVYANADARIGFSPTTSGTTGCPLPCTVRGLVPLGGTAMSAGISAGLGALTNYTYARQDAVGAMILLTDGSPTHLLTGVLDPGCTETNFTACSEARHEVMDQAQIAASKGIVIYTIFVGSPANETQKALILQYVADLTDNGQLEGTYAANCTANAYSSTAFDAISDNYYQADNKDDLEAAYKSIFEKIYTRLVK